LPFGFIVYIIFSTGKNVNSFLPMTRFFDLFSAVSPHKPRRVLFLHNIFICVSSDSILKKRQKNGIIR